MKALKARYILPFALAALATAAPAQNTTKLTASRANEYGIIYNLPQTTLDIAVEIELTETAPGEFANFAPRFFDIPGIITVPSHSASVKSIVVTPRGVPDTENEWLMTFKNSNTVFVVLDDAGVPVAINTEDIPERPAPALPVARAAAPTALEVPAARQAVTQEMQQSTSNSKRAQLAAQRIFELRENRNDLISGQADNTPPDGRSMELALDNLTAQEAALTAMFAGTEKNWTLVQQANFTPGDSEVRNMVIGRISPTLGLVSPDDLSGEPLYLNIDVLTRGELPVENNGQVRRFPEKGVAYNIPGTARVTLSFRNEVVYSEVFELAQLGVAYGLDPKMFTDRRNPSFVIFNPTTGGIVTLGSKQQ